MGTSLVVQWLRFCTLRAGNLGSISGGGTRPHLPQLRVGMLELKRACVPQLRLGAAKLKCVCVCIYIYIYISSVQFSSVQSLSRVQLFATP